MSELINIESEASEFLRLQIFGICLKEAKERLTRIQINNRSKDALKLAWKNLITDNRVVLSNYQSKEVDRVLSKLRSKVSIAEGNLINYITLILHGNKDEAIFKNLERYYNRSLLKAQMKY